MASFGEALGNLAQAGGQAFQNQQALALKKQDLDLQLQQLKALTNYRLGNLDLAGRRVTNQENRTDIYGSHMQDVENRGNAALANAYRSKGLKINPSFDPDQPESETNLRLLPLTREDMSPVEQQQFDLNEAKKQVLQTDATLKGIDAKLEPEKFRLALMQHQLALANLGLRQRAVAVSEKNANRNDNTFDVQYRGTLDGQPIGLYDEQGNPIGTRIYSAIGPSSATRSRADAARSIGPLINHAIDLIQQNKELLGVFPGRVAEAEQSLGNLPPQLAELYGTLKSIYSLAGTMHGWRALQVAQEFEKAYGGLHTNPDALLGGLQAMTDTAASVQKTGQYAPSGHAMTHPASGQPKVATEQDVRDAMKESGLSYGQVKILFQKKGYTFAPAK